MSIERRIAPDAWQAEIADTDGPQLVVAGPGTGKTEFLVRRVTHLLESGVEPGAILVLTFSRRGAADLRRRISERLKRSVGSLSVSTFHSLAIRLLEAHDHNQGRPPPTLLTGPEQIALVAELLADTDPAPWPITHRAMFGTRTFAADVADFLLRMAERRIDPDRLAQLAADRPDWRALPAFADRYLDTLTTRNRIDYGTLLSRAVDLASDPVLAPTGSADRQADFVDGFSVPPETASLSGGKPTDGARELAQSARLLRLVAAHRYVVVDEYQDTSPAQADLLRALTSVHRNLTVAGDPHQSIYGFRGADVSNIARFEGQFRSIDGAAPRRIVLSKSFRVPGPVLAAANRVSAGAALPGGAGPIAPAEHPGSVHVHVFDQASAEAEWVAAEVERLHLAEQVPHRRMAVLVRSTRNLLPELSRALDRRRIPHDTPDIRLVDHPAVQMFLDLALAGATASSPDPLIARLAEAPIRRLLLSPLYELGVAAEREIRRERVRAGSDWVSVLAANPATSDLASLLADPHWATEVSAVDGFWAVWDRLDRLVDFALDEDRKDHRAAWTAFAQVLEQQSERDPGVSLLRYRQTVESDDFEAQPLLSHRADGSDRITLTTLHQAKGLEFDVVFIADATEDTFPDLRRGFNPLDPQALSGPTDRAAWLLDRLREETRLAYTAMTRARSRLIMTATIAGIDESERRPSRFLLAAAGVDTVDDLPPAPSNRDDPLTTRGLEAVLRRNLLDPEQPLADRLAAASVLVHGSPSFWDAHQFAGVRDRGPDRGVFQRPPRLSPTQAESYRDCPRRYVFERRLAMSETSGDHARFGSLVHAVLERADTAAMDAGRPRPERDDAMEALDAVWSEHAAFGSPWLDAIWRQKAVDMLDRLFAEWPADSDATISAEVELHWSAGDVDWVGRADRVERTTDGSIRVVDYKTSRSIMPKYKAARSLQLAFYALAVADDERFEGDVGSAELWYPATPQKGFRRDLDMSALGDLRAELTEIAQSILDERWDPTPGDACERCSVRIVCPEWPEGREAFTS